MMAQMPSRETWHVQAQWPDDPSLYGAQLIVTAFQLGARLEVAVELRYDDAGPYVIGVAARSVAVAGHPDQRSSVSPRDVQRLPLARIVNAALAFAATAEKPTEENNEMRDGRTPAWTDIYPGATARTYYDVGGREEWERAGFEIPDEMAVAAQVAPPTEKPQPGRLNRGFYKWVARQHREHSKAGRQPAKEIAKATGAPENRAHQWIHRARELGDLEPSPRSRRRNS
jgi:hypothetical protein